MQIKTIMVHHLTPVRMAINQKKLSILHWDLHGTTALQNSIEISSKI
jgi:hypothetical protein